MVHTGLPALLEYVPLAQGVHSVASYGEKVPAGQRTGGGPSGTHLLPAGQGGQSVLLNWLVMYVPLLHRTARPVVLHACILCILFEGHGIGADDPLTQTNPTGHIIGVAENPLVGHMYPPGHGGGADNPSTGQKEPAGQILGALNPETGQ